MAEVRYPWVESEDDQGMVYTNQRTKEVSRRHPLDHKFLEMIKRLRAKGAPAGPERTWMLMANPTDPAGEPYFYNFAGMSYMHRCYPL